MKNFAKLILFFSVCFAFFFFAAVFLKFLSSWVDMIRTIPVAPVPGEDAAAIAWTALPVALYLSVLFALSYSARRKIPVPLAIICIFILGSIFTFGSSLGIDRAETVGPAIKPVPAIRGGPGLILSQSENTMILLKNSDDTRGSRVVSIPGKPLIYQEVPMGPNNTIIRLPPLPFRDETPWFIQSLNIDFSLSSAELKSRFTENWISFAAYAFSLVYLLASLRFVLELSRWHLANLFIGALVFRLILALETFINAGEINALIGSFLGKRAPPEFVTPLVFCALGILIIIYTLLARIARSFGAQSSDAKPSGSNHSGSKSFDSNLFDSNNFDSNSFDSNPFEISTADIDGVGKGKGRGRNG